VKFRLSHNPSKNLVWIWLARDLNRLELRDVGIDAACGNMLMAPYLNVKKYIGFDIDESRIKEGTLNNPKLIGIVSSIEEIVNNQDISSKGDIVICMQTLGVNHLFDSENLMQSIENLVLLTKKNGDLIFNVRWPKYFSSREIFNLRQILEKSFLQVGSKNYGSLENLRISKKSLMSKVLITLPLTLLLFGVPIFRKVPLYKKSSTYWYCKSKV
jgi:hypothetical protein